MSRKKHGATRRRTRRSLSYKRANDLRHEMRRRRVVEERADRECSELWRRSRREVSTMKAAWIVAAVLGGIVALTVMLGALSG